MSTVLNPFTYIANPTTGRPVFNGQVYLGEPDTDPIQTVNQIPVRVINEAGVLVPIAQPIRTGPGGIALNQGNPAQLDVVETQYSITIQNSQGTQVYYSPRVDIFGDIGNTLLDVQQFREFGTPRFITSGENGGNPFVYARYARVVYDAGVGDRVYESRIASNTSLPTVETSWSLIDITSLDTLVTALSRPIGSLLMHTTATAPDGYFALDGSTISNGVNTHSDLATSGSLFITISGADIVLDNAVDFIRGKGDSSRIVGDFQSDAIRNIQGSADFVGRFLGDVSTGAMTVTAQGTGEVGAGFSGSNPRINFNASRTVPTADENRPKSLTSLICIYHGVLI